jgi:hypothetical protein
MRSAPASSASSVVRMHRQHDAVAVREIAVHPFDLVGEDVRRRGFDGGGQVHDHLVTGHRAPDLRHSVADLACERELGHAERLGRVLVGPVRFGSTRRLFLDEARAFDGERFDVLFRRIEDDPPERRTDRVVKVHDCARGAIERFECACDEVRARLHEHFDRHVFGNPLIATSISKSSSFCAMLIGSISD